MIKPVKFETAKLAKEKGFDQPCRYFYNKDGYRRNLRYEYEANHNLDLKITSAPTLEELVDWLYEKHQYCVYYTCEVTFTFSYSICSVLLEQEYVYVNSCELLDLLGLFKTPREALEAGVIETLKLL